MTQDGTPTTAAPTEGSSGSAGEGGPAVGTLVVLGASGDLAKRLLLPGLGGLLASPHGHAVRLVGAGSDDWDDATWKDRVRESFATVHATGALVDQVLEATTYLKADVTDPGDLQRLFDACDGAPALYFALPPAVTAKACQTLQGMDRPDGLVLALEKPFGTDRASAEKLNALLATLVPEDRIHRIDHFLGKSDVLNVLGVRFANRPLEVVWSNEHVERIDIVFDESLALEGRAGYYDKAGAAQDMIQSHLLQVLAVLCMDPPATISATDLRDAKAQVLRATKVRGDDPKDAVRRARYTAGTLGDRQIPSYVDEPGVEPDRKTETLARVTVEIDTWRWAGVPVTLQSGKAVGTPRKQATVTFRSVPHLPTGLTGTHSPTVLRIGFGPSFLTLDLDVNGPGDPFVLDRASLKAELGAGQLPPYGQVLMGILDGDPTMSVRADTAVECWRILEPVLAAFADDTVPLEEYPAGSDGPDGWPALP